MTFANQTISEFLEHVASATVTPSGGAVAAIGGAAGAALCEMVCIHTIGKDGYAHVEQELTELRNELGTHRHHLIDLADEDSTAVDELQVAFKTPDDEGRDEMIQEAAKHATNVPLKTAEECLEIIEHASVVTERGNKNAIADAETGAVLAYAALQASIVTVQFNSEMIEDETFVTEMENRATRIDNAAETAIESVTENTGSDFE
jgi:formiminotetrahydrofolate cyclodeaminase